MVKIYKFYDHMNISQFRLKENKKNLFRFFLLGSNLMWTCVKFMVSYIFTMSLLSVHYILILSKEGIKKRIRSLCSHEYYMCVVALNGQNINMGQKCDLLDYIQWIVKGTFFKKN